MPTIKVIYVKNEQNLKRPKQMGEVNYERK